MLDKDYDYKAINTNRKSGVIMHISSLPSKYGIGTFGKEAYEFCDFLKDAGFHYWQILPLGPTSYGDSPYQSFSSFAGNPYFIDLDILKDDGLLLEEEYINIDFGDNPLKVDYAKLYNNRYTVLKKAFERFKEFDKLNEFVEKHSDWVKDYALFIALKNHFNGASYDAWDEDIKNRKEDAIKKYSEKLKNEIQFQYFMQYEFFKQYTNLKKYVNDKGIKIVGDIPIYCAGDSCDVWSDEKQFRLDLVGGCPPDSFSDGGQLWGNPTYDWEYMKKDKYKWWVNRIKKSLKLCDVLRIDHFRGFESYWAIPKGSVNASTGSWVKGPGMDLFNEVKKQLGDIDIIAEDLGYTTKEVVKFRTETGFPGMKVLEFAFDPNNESDFLPHNIERNWAVYCSTHDSDTLQGWIEWQKGTPTLDFARRYLNLTEEEGYAWGILRAAWSSVANIAITQIQDFFLLNNDYRMNLPSTLGNWTFRLDKKYLTKENAKKLYKFNKLYSRLNK